MVMESMGKASPAVTAVETTLQSKPEPTPTVPSNTAKPAVERTRNQAAVPLASAAAS